MLNYSENNSICANLLRKNGVNIDDKTTLKAVASMMGAKARYQDGMKDLNGCVLPKESLSIVESTKMQNKCSLSTKNVNNNTIRSVNKLSSTIDGTLPIDKDVQKAQLNNGFSVYPNEGCYYPIDSSKDAVKFMTDVGQIIDFSNQQILYNMQQKLQSIKNECNELDNQISIESTNLRNVQRQVADQTALCSSYINDISTNTQLLADLTRDLENKRRQKADALAKEAEIAEKWKVKFMLRNPNKDNLCMNKNSDGRFSLENCDPNDVNQHFSYDSVSMHIKNNDMCFDDGGVTGPGQGNFYLNANCDTNNYNQKFKYDPNTNMFSNPYKDNLCMDDGGGQYAGATPFWQWSCDTNNQNQIFERMEIGGDPQPSKGNVVVVCKSNGNDSGCIWGSGTIWSGSQNAYWISQFVPNLSAADATYTKDITVPNSVAVKIYINSDNTCSIYINDIHIGDNNKGWENTETFNASLNAGKNKIKINLKQGENNLATGGILFSMHNANNGAELLVSDGSWNVY